MYTLYTLYFANDCAVAASLFLDRIISVVLSSAWRFCPERLCEGQANGCKLPLVDVPEL